MCKDLEFGKLSESCGMKAEVYNQILQNLDFMIKVKCLLHLYSLNFSHRGLERPA